MLFRDLIDQRALQYPDRVFLIAPESGKQLTYFELRQKACEFALQLARLNFSKGDKFAVLSQNGFFPAISFFGGFYGGFVPVPLNHSAGEAQIASTLDHSDSQIVFATPESEELLRNALQRIRRTLTVIPADVATGVCWRAGLAFDAKLPEVENGDDAILMYTSGTTGGPKGAVISNRSLVRSGWNTVRMYALTESDRPICVMPLYHMNALVVTLLSTFLSGGSVLLPEQFHPNFFWKWVRNYRCSWFALVPSMIPHLIDQKDFDTPLNLRFARCSSAALSPLLQQEFERRIEIPLLQAMGSTETAGTIFSNPLPPGKRKMGSVGISQGWETQMRDPSGELWVRGESIMTGYYKDPVSTTAAFDGEGWFRTGDTGILDEAGYLVLTGRLTEWINKGGEKISPREIEEVLELHPAVMEAATTGIPDDLGGEEIVAYVVTKSSQEVSQDELFLFCEQQIGAIKTPRRIHFLDQLPRSFSGKLDRKKLKRISGAR